MHMLITPDQIRAARALKNWSQTDLAERSGLAVPTIANIEAGKQAPSGKTLEKIHEAFDSNGIEFIGERGVQKKQEQTRVIRGVDNFRKFYEDIYQTLSAQGGEVVVANVDEREFLYYLDDESILLHQVNMRKLKDKVYYKILVKEGDTYYAANSYAEYRWTPKEDFQSIPFYVYGDKLAIILWLDEPVVFLMHSAEAATIYREKFATLWRNSLKPPKNPTSFTEFTVEDLDSLNKSREKAGIFKRKPNKKAGK